MAKRTESKSSSNAKNECKGRSVKIKLRSGDSAGLTDKDIPHVVSVPDGWAVRSSLTGRFVTDFYSKKSDAIDAGQRIARKSGSKVLVHGRSGQVFHRSPVASTISESVIRKAVRATSGESAAKSASKNSATAKSSRKSGSKKK